MQERYRQFWAGELVELCLLLWPTAKDGIKDMAGHHRQKKLLTAKVAKKSGEERREEQPEAFFASSASFLGELRG